MHRVFASPARYIQGPGALERVGPLALQHGESALLISDSDVWRVVGDLVEETFNDVDTGLERSDFTGECSTTEIDRLTDVASKISADVIIGIGGGKAIDTAKAVCARTGGVVGSVPTIASTDAPTSSLSIIYKEEGTFERAHRHDFHPSFIVVDTNVIARAPTRWFISGIGDSLATWFEAKATRKSEGTTIHDTRPTYSGLGIARHSYDLIRENAEDAVHAVNETRS
ncbi:iron-containing alcohol dehydrogenase [Haladaptatus sp. DFWS20]|uniref:iron-containing alcohol dehydrogenase n=1 Tax=Haladaptatus sp. DFWS20 TaxID=3403467 RepID=UPI003EBBFCFD